MNDSIRYLSFSFWLSVIISRSIYVSENSIISFSFMAEYTHATSLSSVDGHIGCFLAIVNSAAVNIGAHVSF